MQYKTESKGEQNFSLQRKVNHSYLYFRHISHTSSIAFSSMMAGLDSRKVLYSSGLPEEERKY